MVELKGIKENTAKTITFRVITEKFNLLDLEDEETSDKKVVDEEIFYKKYIVIPNRPLSKLKGLRGLTNGQTPPLKKLLK